MGLFRKLTKPFLLAHNNLQKKVIIKKLIEDKQKTALFGGITFSCILILLSLIPYFANLKTGGQVLGASISKIKNESTKSLLLSPVAKITSEPTSIPTLTPTATLTPTQTPTPSPTKIPVIIKKPSPTIKLSNPSQYTAEKLNENTWRVKNVSNDASMATADEIVSALNSYRVEHGRGQLIVDAYLSDYARQRADLFASRGSLDGHEGFQSFMSNDGFSKAGFNSLGENSAYISGPMNADKIVRQIFGADASHDGNQLDNWTHVGVGVNGNAINVNFGKGKR